MALQGTGTADYAERLSSDLLDAPPITVCFWVRREGAVAGAGPFGLRNHLGSDDNYLMFYNYTGVGGTDFAWEQGGGSYPNLGPFTLPLNTWQFVAISRSGTGANQTTVYRRVEADGSLTSAAGTFPAVSGGSGITQEVVLAQSYDLTNTFVGRVAHLRQWTSALSEAQLLAESQSATPVITANLHSAHSFDAASVATALLDESGNARNLTLNGTLAIATGPTLGGGGATVTSDVSSSAAISTTNSSDVTSSAAVSRTEQANVTSSAALSRTEQSDVSSSAALSTTNSLSVSSSAAVSRTEQANVTSDACITVAGAVSADVSSSAAISRTEQADVSSSGAVSRVEQSEVSTSAAISQSVQANVTTSAAISRTEQAEVSSDACISVTGFVGADVATSAAITRVEQADVSSSAAVSRLITADISSSAAIALSGQVDVSSSAAVTRTEQADVASTAAISIDGLAPLPSVIVTITHSQMTSALVSHSAVTTCMVSHEIGG